MTTLYRPWRALCWAVETFGPVALAPRERSLRFLEEALEAVNAMGLEEEVVHKMVARCWQGRPGMIVKELAQAQMTLEVLAKSINVDLDEAANQEFFRVQQIPKEEWVRRHNVKVASGLADPIEGE